MTTEIFGFTFYYAGALVWMWFIVWLPLAWGMVALARKPLSAMLASFKRHHAIHRGVNLLILFLPWVGVLRTSVEANYFCHKYAGTHVYKTISQ